MLIGKQAINFQAQALVDGTIKQISLNDLADHYKILFFYPLDFTFVCPTELLAFQERLADFKQRQAVVIGISVDSVFTHRAWTQVPRERGGIAGVTYPLVSDINKTIARDYDVLDEAAGVALRGIFIIDKSNIVQTMQVNNEQFGRNIDEILRLLDAVIFNEQHGQVCPANWQAGKKGLESTQEGVEKYFQEHV